MGSHRHPGRGASRAAQADPYARGLGRRRQRCRSHPAFVAQPAAAVSRPRSSPRGSWRPGCSAARRSRSCCIRPSKARQAMSTGARSAGDDGLAAGLFSVVFDERYSTAAGRCLLRRACKLFKLGYSWGGPVSLVVPYDIASMRSARLGVLDAQGRSGAVFRRAGGGGRPARGPGAGAGCPGVAVDYPAGLLSLTLAPSTDRNGRPCGDTQLRIREAAERAGQEAQEGRQAQGQGRPQDRRARRGRCSVRRTRRARRPATSASRTPRRRPSASSRISRANSAIAAADRSAGAMDFASA